MHVAAPVISRSPARARARASPASTSPSGCSSARAARRRRSSGWWATRSTFHSRTPRSTARPSASACATWKISSVRCASCGASSVTAAAWIGRALLQIVVRRNRPAARQAAPGRLGVHLPSGERAAISRARGVGGADAGCRVRGRSLPSARGRHRRAAYRGGRVTTQVAIHDARGLEAYLAELEDRLEHAVGSHRGVVADVGGEALAAGGKRLRPLLVYLSAPQAPTPIEAGVAVELVHMATLMHDDLIDGARVRRGRASAWSAYGPEAARAAGDYLFARAFAEISATRDPRLVAVLADATLCLARGEAMQRSQRYDPDTPVDAYLERCALKTGKLFEAACVLGGGSGAFGLALGIAFQITDDILDCAGVTFETGKIAGTDLREGTPTLPLLLAARRDDAVREALAGGALADGVLLRVVSTGALEESREVALAYARNARACLNGELHRDELESLTHAIVDRDR